MNSRLFANIVLLPLIFLMGCKNKTNEIAKPGEGTIRYSITYPDSLNYGLKARFFPKTITLIFKDERAVFIASAGLGMVQMVDLLDHKNKTFTSLLIDQLHGNYGCKLTSDEIAANENSPEYKFELTKETKEIEGLISNKAVVSDMTNNSRFEIYYYEKIKFYYWNSPYKNMNYLFTQYEHTINNLKMNLKAIDVDLTTPVDTTLFQIKGNYNWVSQKEFFAHLNQL